MITERIIKYLDIKGITKYKFCKDLGFSNGFLDKSREISTDKYANILEYFPEINPDWLLTGNGPMLKDGLSVALPIEDTASGIPLVNIDAAAGFGTGVFAIEKQDIQALYKVPDFNGIDFMIRVKGNSMYPKYSSGDIVACRILKDSKFIEWNKPHLIATTEHGLIVKRLRKSDLADHIQAVSDNKDYDAFDIPQDEITGLAIIVGVIRLE